jgi:hypothetical protein
MQDDLSQLIEKIVDRKLRHYKGKHGDQGHHGDPGLRGFPGPYGVTGATGPTGPTGETGDAGQGATYNGVDGATGETGPFGSVVGDVVVYGGTAGGQIINGNQIIEFIDTPLYGSISEIGATGNTNFIITSGTYLVTLSFEYDFVDTGNLTQLETLDIFGKSYSFTVNSISNQEVKIFQTIITTPLSFDVIGFTSGSPNLLPISNVTLTFLKIG